MPNTPNTLVVQREYHWQLIKLVWVYHILCSREIYSLEIQSQNAHEAAVTPPRMISFSATETGEPLWNPSHLYFRGNNTLSVRKTNLAFLEVGATPSQHLWIHVDFYSALWALCVFTSSAWQTARDLEEFNTILQWGTQGYEFRQSHF